MLLWKAVNMVKGNMVKGKIIRRWKLLGSIYLFIYFLFCIGYLMWRADSLEKMLVLGNIEAGGAGATEDEIIWWHHRLIRHEFEQILGDSEG